MVQCERWGKNEETERRKRGKRIYWRKSRKKDGRQNENSCKCVAEEPGILEDDPSEQLISPANVIAVIRLCWMYLERSGHIPVAHRRKVREGDDRRRAREKTRQRNLNRQQGDSCFCSDSQGILYWETSWKILQPSSTGNNQMHWCLRIRRPEN